MRAYVPFCRGKSAVVFGVIETSDIIEAWDDEKDAMRCYVRTRGGGVVHLFGSASQFVSADRCPHCWESLSRIARETL